MDIQYSTPNNRIFGICDYRLYIFRITTSYWNVGFKPLLTTVLDFSRPVRSTTAVFGLAPSALCTLRLRR